MRDLDQLGLLKNDFFVVYGDVVSNLSLEVALAEHKNRRTKDKNAIMTMVLRQVSEVETEQGSSRDGGPIFAIDPRKDRCLHYETMVPNQTGHSVQIDPDILNCPEMDLRADLMDCGIDICTPDVLALWSDNFDFRTPRHNFLHSVLKDYELNGKTIHTHIVLENYAARVESPMAYDAVSKDIINCFVYPFTPDTNLLMGQTYERESGWIYKEQTVFLARSSKIGMKTVLAAGCSVGEGTSISNSVIGQRCMIGRNVVLNGAYIWDDAVIGDGSVVTRAVVANEAVVGKNCIIEAGALISYSVKIADGTTVKGSSRITRVNRKSAVDSEEEEELTRARPDPRVVGINGDGVEYFGSDEEDDDDEGQDYFGPARSHGLGMLCTHTHIPRSCSFELTSPSLQVVGTFSLPRIHLNPKHQLFCRLRRRRT
jgi:translation initiation factor eIF-2B subunit epsilon